MNGSDPRGKWEANCARRTVPRIPGEFDPRSPRFFSWLMAFLVIRGEERAQRLYADEDSAWYAARGASGQ